MNQLLHFKANMFRQLLMNILDDQIIWKRYNKVKPRPKLWPRYRAHLLIHRRYAFNFC